MNEMKRRTSIPEHCGYESLLFFRFYGQQVSLGTVESRLTINRGPVPPCSSIFRRVREDLYIRSYG